MGFVAGCVDPAMFILLVVKLLDFFFLFMCKELDRELFQTHCNKNEDACRSLLCPLRSSPQRHGTRQLSKFPHPTIPIPTDNQTRPSLPALVLMLFHKTNTMSVAENDPEGGEMVGYSCDGSGEGRILSNRMERRVSYRANKRDNLINAKYCAGPRWLLCMRKNRGGFSEGSKKAIYAMQQKDQLNKHGDLPTMYISPPLTAME